jgi:carboxyl-terminal processing protease
MQRRLLHHAFVLVAAVAVGMLLWPSAGPTVSVPPPAPVPLPPPVSSAAEAPSDPEPAAVEPAPESCKGNRPLVSPSGAPPRLSCPAARAILAEMRERFAGDVSRPNAKTFAKLMMGWIDPHGLWSAAPDAPLPRALRDDAAALLEEIAGRVAPDGPCRRAEAFGRALDGWVGELERTFDRATKHASVVSRERAANLGRAGVFQDDPVTEPARVLARRLGDTVARFSQAFPGAVPALADTARARYFPRLGALGWSEVVLAAAVRAYVPLVDPHGDWAPFEEEWSLYAEDPGLDADPRLWHEITRTAVGIRIVDAAAGALAMGDLVLAVDGVLTAGMPLEQAEQLGRLEPHEGGKRTVAVLRRAHTEIETLDIDLSPDDAPAEGPADLESETVRFGDEHVLIVRVPDVPDGLGESLGRTIAHARPAGLSGVLLDLRGNGGGSTDAAAAVLGLFLPSAPLFPLANRSGLVEVLGAPEPSAELRYEGPIASLVDGYTASAAEMIAGALSAYGRGPTLGVRTFGKGCIQEYVDDKENKGVLRVTTLLFALPDGSPVQRSGLVPDVLLPGIVGREHEGDLLHSLATYRGPDVRTRVSGVKVPWPSHRGHVGPCSDRRVCRALWRLGAAEVAKRSASSARVASRSGTASPRP